MSGRRLAASLVAIVLLAFVLPMVGAMQVNVRRVEQAGRQERALLDELARASGGALDRARAVTGADPVVFAGEGTAPKFAPGTGWPDAKPGVIHAALDPWGNQYLAVVPADPAAPIVVLSAGPNGIVETAFSNPAERRGDDVTSSGVVAARVAFPSR